MFEALAGELANALQKSELLSALVQEYDDRHHELPELKPHEMIQFLMAQKDLRQIDMLQSSDLIG